MTKGLMDKGTHFKIVESFNKEDELYRALIRYPIDKTSYALMEIESETRTGVLEMLKPILSKYIGGLR